MDNINNNTTTPPTPEPKSPMQNINEMKNKVVANLPQNIKDIQVPKVDMETIKAKKGPIKKLLIIPAILVVLLVIVPPVARLVRKVPLPILQASPTPAPTPTPGNGEKPSQYADDEDLKRIEERISEFRGKAGETDLREDTIRLPSLDFNIKFE